MSNKESSYAGSSRCRAKGWAGIAVLSLLLIAAAADLLCGYDLASALGAAPYWPFIDRIVKTDGMRAVITALGTVCFALSYINTAKTQRVRGVLLNDVIQYYYPHYGYVFLLHGSFAVLGQYTCTSGIRSAGVLCLVGVFLCLIYILKMSIEVCFSQNRCNELVMKYIKMLSDEEPREDHSHMVRQVARYTAQRYLEQGIGAVAKSFTPKENEAPSFVQLLVDLTSPNPEPSQKFRGSFSDTFTHIFKSIHQQSFPTRPSYILYSLPDFLESRDTFQRCVLRFDTMWRNMLSPIPDEEQAARLISQILYEEEDTTALCCGLIRYLHSSRIPSTDTASKDGWSACARLLSRVSHIIETDMGSVHEDAKRKAATCCMDMSITFLCLAFFEQANTQNKLDVSPFRTLTLNDLNAYNGTDSSIYYSEEALSQYLCYAYVILLSLALPGIRMPSRTDMRRQLPAIIHAIEQLLNVRQK